MQPTLCFASCATQRRCATAALATGSSAPLAAPSPVAHLLPAYDEYTVAYKDHSVILDPPYLEQIVAASGIAIVTDGRIVGGWKRVLKKDSVLLTLSPFASLTEAEEQALAAIAEQYSAFLGRPVLLAEEG